MPVALVSSGAFAVPAGITGTFTSPDVWNPGCGGVKVVLDMTVNAGGLGSVVLKIQGKDPVSGRYLDLLTSGAVSTVSTNVYTVYPTIAAVANKAVRDALPAVWRVTCSGNGSPTTFTVGFSMVP